MHIFPKMSGWSATGMHIFPKMSRSHLKIPVAGRVTRIKVHTEYLLTHSMEQRPS